jgi:hypothetical protein
MPQMKLSAKRTWIYLEADPLTVPVEVIKVHKCVKGRPERPLSGAAPEPQIFVTLAGFAGGSRSRSGRGGFVHF